MARRLTTAGTALQQKTINPFSQPCFTAYTMNHSHGGGYYQYDHNFNLIAADHGTGDGSGYGTFRTYTTSATEFFESSSSYSSTQTNETSSTNGGWYCCHTPMVGYLGHMSHTQSGGSSGNMGGWIAAGRDNGTSYRAYAFRECVPIVGETSQDYALFFPNGHNQSKQELILGQRSATNYYSLRRNGRYTGRTYIPNTWEDRDGNSTNFYTTYGGGCYNKKQNKFLIMYTTTDGRFKPVVYNNVPDLREFAHNAQALYNNNFSSSQDEDSNANKLYEYFHNTANATEYQQITGWSPYNNLSSTNESRYRPVPFLCDNGDILLFSMNPSYGYSIWKWDGTTKQQVRISTNENNLNQNGEYYHAYNWTTNYGHEQAHQWGSRWQVSTDGKYAWAYCASYYYGAGAYWMAVRISDGKILKYEQTDSTYGRQPCPVGTSSMGWLETYNTDGGAGLYFSCHDLEYEFERRGNGQNVQLDGNYIYTHFEAGTYSTSYPCIIPAHYDTSLFNSEPHMPNLDNV
jgi:hypothetical protein